MADAPRSNRDRTQELFETLRLLDPADADYKAVRNELVSLHLPLVRYVARRYVGRGETADDLMQIGTVGLIHAIDRFDADRGLAFSTYATPNIAGEIKRHFRDRGWMVRVPRRLQELQVELLSAISELSQRHGRSPTVAEIATHLGLTEEVVLEATESAQAYNAVPIDVPNSTTGLSVADQLVEEADPMQHVELRQLLRPVLADLAERERRALVMRFVDNKTQSEIAEELGISQVHVSRLLARTLSQLRDRLADVHPID